MSVASVIIHCEKCDYRASSNIVNGLFSYIVDGKRVHTDRRIGWCNECEELRPLEYFKPDKLLAAVRQYLAEMDNLKPGGLLHLISSSRRYQIKNCRQKIEEATLALHIAAKRTGSEKCLSCGSDNIDPNEGDYTLEYDVASSAYVDSKRSGLYHPRCGGEFIVTPDPVRYNITFDDRCYDFNGIRLSDSSDRRMIKP